MFGSYYETCTVYLPIVMSPNLVALIEFIYDLWYVIQGLVQYIYNTYTGIRRE